MRKSVIDVCRIWGAAGFLLAGLAAGASEAAPTPDKPETVVEAPFGAYLAGRHAQHMRDYQSAVRWVEDALRADPESPELSTRGSSAAAVGEPPLAISRPSRPSVQGHEP